MPRSDDFFSDIYPISDQFRLDNLLLANKKGKGRTFSLSHLKITVFPQHAKAGIHVLIVSSTVLLLTPRYEPRMFIDVVSF